MVDRDLRHKLDRAALAGVESATIDVAAGRPSGARVLDRWRSGEHAAALFWVDAEFDPWGFGHGDATLHLSEQQFDGKWRGAGGGGFGTFTAAECIAKDGVGPHRLGGSSGGPARLTVAVATPEVSSIELCSDRRSSSRPPGAEGFCLLGITDNNPITYARALDANGQPLGGESVLL